MKRREFITGVAGLGAALEHGGSLRDAAAVGVATASASVAHDLAGGVDPVLLGELLKTVRVAAAAGRAS